MPRMIPTPLPEIVCNDPLRAAERAVYEAFASHAPDDSIIFYSVAWLGRPFPGNAPVDGETDFVVAHPDGGLLLIEVKGGRIRYDGPTNRWYSNENSISDPFNQVKKSKYALLGKIKQMPAWKHKYVKIGHCVIFPGSARPEGPLSTDSAHEMMGFARDLNWLDKWLNEAYSYWAGQEDRHGEFGQPGMEMIEKLLARSFELKSPLAAGIATDANRIYTLTENQYNLISFIAGKRRVAISGGAGTGKTMLALEKARRLAGEGMKVLVTCFNKALAEFMASQTADVYGLTVLNFHALCHDFADMAHIVEARERNNQSSDYYDKVLPIAFEKALEVMPEERFDAIIVDESQDFKEDWWTLLQLALTDPDQGILYVFYDDNQRLYWHRGALPEELDPYSLDQNLRNTRSIHQLAARFYDGKSMEAGGPEGRPVEFIEAKGERERVKGVSRTLNRLVREEKIPLSSIAVLTARSQNKTTLVKDGKIGAFTVCSGEECDENKVVFDTIRRFKGLERPVIILVELEDALDQEDLLYVGITRANAHLVVVGHDKVIKKVKGF